MRVLPVMCHKDKHCSFGYLMWKGVMGVARKGKVRKKFLPKGSGYIYRGGGAKGQCEDELTGGGSFSHCSSMMAEIEAIPEWLQRQARSSWRMRQTDPRQVRCPIAEVAASSVLFTRACI